MAIVFLIFKKLVQGGFKKVFSSKNETTEILPVKGIRFVKLPYSTEEKLLILDEKLSFELPASCTVEYGDDFFTGFFSSTKIRYSGGFIYLAGDTFYQANSFFNELLEEFNGLGKEYQDLGQKKHEYDNGKKCLTQFFSRTDDNVERIFIYTFIEFTNNKYMIFIQSTHKNNFEKVGYSFQLPFDTLANYYENQNFKR